MNTYGILATLLVTGLAAVPSVGHAQEPLGAYLGGVALRIGMPELEARRLLERTFDLRTNPNAEEILFVQRRGAYETVGTLNILDGRVVMVSENWPIQDVARR